MIVFWTAVVAMLLLGLAFFVPVLRGRLPTKSLSRARLNVLLHEQRREELAREAADPADLRSLAAESERNLLGDLETAAAPAPQDPAAGRTALVAALALLPLFALVGYLALGRPDLLDQPPPADRSAQMEEAVRKLADRLKQNPNDLEGWTLLGRSLLAMGEAQKALQAFEFAGKLAPDNLDIMALTASALAETNQGSLAGRPAELAEAILKKDPNHLQGLWLAGMAAAEQRDLPRAAEYWEKLKAQFPPDSEEAAQVGRYIAEVRGQAPPAETTPAAAPGLRIKVKASLAPGLQSQAAPEDAVFIFARAAEGPPMPLAVVRKQVRDLPVEVELNDSMAMMKGMNLSAFPRLVIGARVSKSGQPTASPGDLQGLSEPVSAKDRAAYTVEIGTVVGGR